MAHVDYVMWAEYIFEILNRYHPEGNDILELGCGTGSLAAALQPLAGYTFHATDLSADMLKAARAKALRHDLPISFEAMDFRAVPSEQQYDAILLLYDGINYITNPTEVSDVCASAFCALRPGGLFVFDQSTPANSRNHADGFDDAGKSGSFRYLRTSSYDAETQIHTTLFRLDIDGRAHTEKHTQRSYTLAEMEAAISASGFIREASYDAFSSDPATEGSERIHHILRRPRRG